MREGEALRGGVFLLAGGVLGGGVLGVMGVFGVVGAVEMMELLLVESSSSYNSK